LLHLAATFPGWRFTAVDPSVPMLDVLRHKADEQGILGRCVLHAGYLDSLPTGDDFDAATSFLVSHFITDRDERAGFFREIADRLGPDGVLINADLAGDLDTGVCQDLLRVWCRVMSGSGFDEAGVQRLRDAYARDVGVLHPRDVADLLVLGGFDSPVAFYQAGMIHAWYARRSRQPGRVS
jgi:tRNA (cmo5U34)-methyltransferase